MRLNEQSPLLNGDAPLASGPEAPGAPPTVASVVTPHSGWAARHWLGLLAMLALLASVVWIKVDSESRIELFQAQLLDARARLDALESDSQAKFYVVQDAINALQQKDSVLVSFTSRLNATVSQQNQTQARQMGAIAAQLLDHGKALVRLSNGTSNADVLDKLVLTKVDIEQQLVSTKRNVSALLDSSALQLQNTQQEVALRLNTTMAAVRQAVGDATQHIHEVQRNVTGQLDGMSQHLAVTVKELASTVDAAKDTIHEEVSTVQASIEQYVLVTNKQFAAENDFVKYQVAGTFTLLSVLIFLAHITNHARHYHKPEAQRRIMAVLWMVPIYGITSWVSLMKPSWEPTLGALRDLAEAYVIYTFVGLLVAVLSDGLTFSQLIDKLADHVSEERAALEAYRRAESAVRDEEASNGAAAAAILAAGRPKEHVVPPCTCSCLCLWRGPQGDPEAVARAWLWQCQLLAMQFVFAKPLTTFVPLLLSTSGLYDLSATPWWLHGQLNWHSPRLYIIGVQNLSVALAFSGLLSFFHGAERDLEWCNPWPKFLCIKGVVFATFWQYLALQAMSAYGLVDERTAAQCQNLLICVEMLIASIAHLYIFPHQEWAPTYRKERQRSLMLRDTMALGDFMRDMRRLATPWDSVKKHEEQHHEPTGSAGVELARLGHEAHVDEAPGREEQAGDSEADATSDTVANPLLQELRDELIVRLNLINEEGAEGDTDCDHNGGALGDVQAGVDGYHSLPTLAK